jgi:hypothetical protein
MTKDSDDQVARRERLWRDSDRLLAAAEEVRELESRKRDEVVSTPSFHKLADDIVTKSREVFHLATREADDDDDTDTSDVTLNEVAGDRHG